MSRRNTVRRRTRGAHATTTSTATTTTGATADAGGAGGDGDDGSPGREEAVEAEGGCKERLTTQQGNLRRSSRIGTPSRNVARGK